MATIRRLDDAARERIAAGEVVTRPARAVAELVENALDAGASRIDVEVDGDGTELIRVRDDGRGMSPEDAERAVERHATSKIADAADLDAVETLGFRGEALASIAAVSRLELVTNDGGPRGTRVRVADGETRVQSAARGEGTTVTVRDLFHNRAPRRETLAAAATEFSRISRVTSRYALIRPDVRFRLVHDGMESFSTPGSGDDADALLGVYDRDVASESAAFEHETSATVDGEAHPLRVDGVVCYPSVTRATAAHVAVAVNGRAVRADALRRAVREGYGSLLPDDRHPVAVARVSLPSAAVDANVHPAKTEVGLRVGDAATDAVRTAVADALSTADLRRTAEVTMDLDASLAPVESDSAFADATVVGRFRDLYLLCEADDELLVVDQHAAHERINYERLRSTVDGGVETAPLDPPATLSLSPTAAATAEANREVLARIGYELAPFGGDAYRVSAVPAPLGRVADPESLRDVLDVLADGGSPADRREELLADLACHPSLKAGDELSTADAEELVDRLGGCEQPYACPHGRPTVLSIEEATLAKGFGRSATRMD